MQDPNPLPWGAEDRFQAHFIVRANLGLNDANFVARTKLKTQGHFGSKKLVGIEWIGGKISQDLNNDGELTKLILKQSFDDAQIWIDPTKNGVRIYGKWKNSYKFVISKDLFTICDVIASHIKKAL